MAPARADLEHMRNTGAVEGWQRLRESGDTRQPRVSKTGAAAKVAEILGLAGIELNGRQPWDLQARDPRFFERVLAEGSIGLGESFVDGWWDADALDEFFTRFQRADLYKCVRDPLTLLLIAKSRVLNMQTKSRSRRVAQDHYDLGNDLFEAMLGPRMQYTCAYWPRAKTLDQAQSDKLDLICRKLSLSPGMTVLELGGGFGGLAQFVAKEYGCSVVSYNISREQVEFGRQMCQGLPVRIEQKDYRKAIHEPQAFDRVVSIGLCEHIGYRNYRAFLELAHARLKPGGLFLLHTIGGNISVTYTDPWFDKYIFPNGVIPSVAQLGAAMENLWVVEDWHNFGPDYDLTLMAWWRNFDRAWPALQSNYGERFYRMWKYYLMASAGSFRSRKLQLWQIVLSKGDVASYAPVR